MALPDSRVTIKDGGLGVATDTGDGVHVKIGVSTAAKNQIMVLTSSADPDKIKEKLGISPLADAVMDSIQAGAALIYCIPTEGTITGSVSAVAHEGTGLATHAVSGSPNNNYEVEIEILAGGQLNEATYKYTIDGNNYTKEKTMPIDGIVDIEDTGVKITFTEDGVTPEDSFVKGDKYSFTTEAPTMSNQEVLDAVAVLYNTTLDFEFIHVVGESESPLWTALAAETDILFETYFKSIYFVCESRRENEGETLDAYVLDLISSRQAVASYRIQVVPARAELSAKDGKIRDTNGASLVAGLYAKAAVSQSIGEVKEFPLPGIVKLLPEGIEDYIQTLDEAKFLTFRQYIGVDGFYVTNARMFAIDGSDYQYAETVRTMNKAVTEIRKQALFFEHSRIDPTDTEGSLKVFKEYLQLPLERMVDDKDLISGMVVIPEDQDVLGTSKIKVKARAVPMAIMREIEIEFGLTNPFA